MNELIAKLKKLSIFKHKWVQFLMYLIKNFIDDNCSQKAALLTYTTLLSIVPILTLLVVILSTIPQLAEAREQIQNLIFSNILPSTGLQVTKYLNQFTSNSSNLTIIGVGILFFTTISTLTTIETAFNQIWRVEKRDQLAQSCALLGDYYPVAYCACYRHDCLKYRAKSEFFKSKNWRLWD